MHAQLAMVEPSSYDSDLAYLSSISLSAVDWALTLMRLREYDPRSVLDWSDADLMAAVVSYRWDAIVTMAADIAHAKSEARVEARARARKRGSDGKRAIALSRHLR